MNKYLILLALGFAIVGCKRKDVTPLVGDDEILIGTTNVVVSKAKLNETFVDGDQIGVFSVVNGANVINPNRQANCVYTYDLNNVAWNPISKESALLWQFDGEIPSRTEVPVDLIAYYPYNSALVVDADNVSVEFAVQTNQTLKADLQKSDVMWARSTGKTDANEYEQLKPGFATINGKGIAKSKDVGQRIDLKFNHLFASIVHKVVVFQQTDGTETFSDVKLTKIEIEGAKIETSGKLNVCTGVFTPTANGENVKGSIVWEPEVPVDITTLLNSGDSPQESNYVEAGETVVLPQVFRGTVGNVIKYTITYTHDADGAGTASAPEVITKTYQYVMGSGVASGIDEFLINTQLTAKARITLNSNEIKVTTSIIPWEIKEIEYPAE